MNRLTVISKNINKREINMVVVHSFTDAHKEAMDAMERGCDEAVVEDEVHNVVLRLIKPKKTNFDRITASPETLAKWLESHLNYCGCDEADLSRNNFDCSSCPYCKDDICLDDKEKWLIWLNEESNE